jgi:hypothetical protein
LPRVSLKVVAGVGAAAAATWAYATGRLPWMPGSPPPPADPNAPPPPDVPPPDAYAPGSYSGGGPNAPPPAQGSPAQVVAPPSGMTVGLATEIDPAPPPTQAPYVPPVAPPSGMTVGLATDINPPPFQVTLPAANQPTPVGERPATPTRVISMHLGSGFGVSAVGPIAAAPPPASGGFSLTRKAPAAVAAPPPPPPKPPPAPVVPKTYHGLFDLSNVGKAPPPPPPPPPKVIGLHLGGINLGSYGKPAAAAAKPVAAVSVIRLGFK